MFISFTFKVFSIVKKKRFTLVIIYLSSAIPDVRRLMGDTCQIATKW